MTGMKNLHHIDVFRPKEIHCIIIWDCNLIEKADKIIEASISDKMTIKEKTIIVDESGNDEIIKKLYKKVYFTKNMKKAVGNKFYLVILEDCNPKYSVEDVTTGSQVVNSNMHLLKLKLRKALGGSVNANHTVHGTYNLEESYAVLKPLGLEGKFGRPKFETFVDFFQFINSYKGLKYYIQRGYSYIDLNKLMCGDDDIDIVVNDYFLFKNITGALSRRPEIGVERAGGYCSGNYINICNKEIKVDIRYPGDNYIDDIWYENMMKKIETYHLWGEIPTYVPCETDSLYTLIHHVLLNKYKVVGAHKHDHYLIYLAKNNSDFLPALEVVEKIIFSRDKLIPFFNDYMKKNQYFISAPIDKTVRFSIPEGIDRNIVK